MNINSISPKSPSISGDSLGTKEDPQIKNLEQKLLQLNKEMEKAKKAKNSDKVRELEQKIQEIQRQLEKLRKKKAEKEDETETKAPSSKLHLPKSNVGNYVDESV